LAFFGLFVIVSSLFLTGEFDPPQCTPPLCAVSAEIFFLPFSIAAISPGPFWPSFSGGVTLRLVVTCRIRPSPPLFSPAPKSENEASFFLLSTPKSRGATLPFCRSIRRCQAALVFSPLFFFFFSFTGRRPQFQSFPESASTLFFLIPVFLSLFMPPDFAVRVLSPLCPQRGDAAASIFFPNRDPLNNSFTLKPLKRPQPQVQFLVLPLFSLRAHPFARSISPLSSFFECDASYWSIPPGLFAPLLHRIPFLLHFFPRQ